MAYIKPKTIASEKSVPKITTKFKCCDCGEKNFVRIREQNRSSRPRCNRCGGPLDPLYEE